MRKLAILVALTLTNVAHAQAWGDDDPVQWIIDNGFSSIHFMQSCVSVGPHGEEARGEQLPVGGGYTLWCDTYSQINYDATEVQANDGSRYCVLGTLSGSGKAGGDERLRIEVMEDGTRGPATVRATAGQPTWIYLASGFGGASVWPLWIESNYATQELVPAPNDGRTCKQAFGL
jgi:hypothetical protein